MGPILTPPESSEDEDFVHGTYKSKAAQDILKSRKSVLKEIENDRFNKVFKSILLKSSSKSLSTNTNIDKAKFKFSICMNQNKKRNLLGPWSHLIRASRKIHKHSNFHMDYKT